MKNNLKLIAVDHQTANGEKGSDRNWLIVPTRGSRLARTAGKSKTHMDCGGNPAHAGATPPSPETVVTNPPKGVVAPAGAGLCQRTKKSNPSSTDCRRSMTKNHVKNAHLVAPKPWRRRISKRNHRNRARHLSSHIRYLPIGRHAVAIKSQIIKKCPESNQIKAHLSAQMIPPMTGINSIAVQPTEGTWLTSAADFSPTFGIGGEGPGERWW